MTTGTLFDHLSAEHRLADAYRRLRAIKPKRPLIGHDHPVTSHAMAAALADTDLFAYRLERLLLAVHHAGDAGIIDDELLVVFERWGYSSVTSGMSRLRKEGVIRHGPDTRATRYGNQALINRVA